MSISRKIHYGSHLPRFIAVFAMMVCLVPLAASSAIAREKAAKPAVNPLFAEIDSRSDAVAAKVITWRRDIHEHPELSNREVRTGKMVADLLTSLGLEVQTGVAHTGVVGVLKGGKPGPCVALRADMDALPVTEETGLPFASKVTAEYNGEQVGVISSLRSGRTNTSRSSGRISLSALSVKMMVWFFSSTTKSSSSSISGIRLSRMNSLSTENTSFLSS